MLSARFIGASGMLTIIAPFPASEYGEIPFSFVAAIIAYTLDPQVRLYGDEIKTETGIAQDFVDIKLEGLQFTDSVV